MTLEIVGRLVDARLEYNPSTERLVLRTDFALISPDAIDQVHVRLLRASDAEVELLKASGYRRLVEGEPTSTS